LSRGFLIVAVILAGSLLAYSAVAVTRHWWPSAVMAPLLAVLLWRRHRRARFSAYVFFSVLAARGTLTGFWALPAYAAVAIGLLQTPAALVAWPRLQLGRTRADPPPPDDRMRRA